MYYYGVDLAGVEQAGAVVDFSGSVANEEVIFIAQFIQTYMAMLLIRFIKLCIWRILFLHGLMLVRSSRILCDELDLLRILLLLSICHVIWRL